jgi:hypothetical protein
MTLLLLLLLLLLLIEPRSLYLECVPGLSPILLLQHGQVVCPCLTVRCFDLTHSQVHQWDAQQRH